MILNLPNILTSDLYPQLLSRYTTTSNSSIAIRELDGHSGPLTTHVQLLRNVCETPRAGFEVEECLDFSMREGSELVDKIESQFDPIGPGRRVSIDGTRSG